MQKRIVFYLGIVLLFFVFFIVFLFLGKNRLPVSIQRIIPSVSLLKDSEQVSFENKIFLEDQSSHFNINLLNSAEKQDTIFRHFPQVFDDTKYDSFTIVLTDREPANMYVKRTRNDDLESNMGYQTEYEGKHLRITIYVNPESKTIFPDYTADDPTTLSELMIFAALSREKARPQDPSDSDGQSLDYSIVGGREFRYVFRQLFPDGLVDVKYE